MAPEIAEKDFPAGASEYHWTLGALQLAGVEAAALKVAAAGAVTVCAVGSSVIAGAAEQTATGALTVRVTAFVVVSPFAFLKIASNFVPLSAVVVAGVV